MILKKIYYIISLTLWEPRLTRPFGNHSPNPNNLKTKYETGCGNRDVNWVWKIDPLLTDAKFGRRLKAVETRCENLARQMHENSIFGPQGYGGTSDPQNLEETTVLKGG